MLPVPMEAPSCQGALPRRRHVQRKGINACQLTGYKLSELYRFRAMDELP